MPEIPNNNQSGGVNVYGGTVNTGGDIVGRDKIVTQLSRHEIDEVLKPVTETITTVSAEQRPEALAKLDQIKAEAAKGTQRDDSVLAKLIDGFVALVPKSVSAVVGAFGTPILGGLAGPFTKFILDKIQGR